ncbi:Serine/threonine protein kinase [Micromonospora matsumotoense]|uniref:Serine/threonine protein kinase n=1 Tax=Micromonospora matsumotoense TaxID=121616 RepID=A0A1C5A462_9ACTN|nr:protein kinase [Micromonospora matsumotoense]SCF40005.1 Serine/threonine protein kinase [Micromonospora matsumotoense]
MDTAYRVTPLRTNDPERLGEYLLIGRLGSGGMGVVYLAESDDGSHVAVKLIHAALAADPEFSGRFRSEVERARQVPPYCTAEFLDADLDHDPPYLVVEYIDGPGLDEVVAERGPLRGGALHSLAVGVATALTGIHGAGIIHRDLKPSNVLLALGSPKVIDFGIARPFEATSQHTRTDVMVGTVAYMAPERFSDGPDTPVTAAADVFAWGCVIAFAGTGRTPFRGDSASATAARILTQPPRLDGLPDSLREPVARALAKDPADRPTAPQLVSMLLGNEPVPRPPSVDQRPPAGPEHRPPPVEPERRTWSRGRRRAVWTALVVLPVVVGVTIASRVVNLDSDSGAGPATPSAVVSSAPTTAGPVAPVPLPVPATATPAPQQTPSSGQRPDAASPSVDDKPSRPTGSTGPPPPANSAGRNLALGQPVTVSGSEGPPWAAANAVDGDLVTRWGSQWSDVGWLTVDLGAQRQIREILLRWEHAYAVEYRVEISSDGRKWTAVYRTSSGQGGDVRVTTDKVAGRYVRMYGTQRSNMYGYSLYEIEVR